MTNTTPFFAGFHRLLFGRPARSAQHRLQTQMEALRRASLCQLATLFEASVPPSMLAPRPGSRQRRFPTAVTFWAFLSQTLSPGSPCRETLRKVQGWCSAQNLPVPHSNTGGYCKARERLAQSKLREIHRHGVLRMEANLSTQQLWLGRRVKVVDGTGVSMPDTPKNQKAFPQPSGQKPGCGFPGAKLVACFCLGTGALIDWVEGTLRNHEHGLFPGLWHLFEKGDVLLGDRGFCSFETIATLMGAGVDSVLRLHQARSTDFRKGKRIGTNQRLVSWPKPKKRPAHASKDEWMILPETIVLRYLKIQVTTPGFRTQQIIVVTTLLDTQSYPAEQLAHLYFRRWKVELFFRDIKITLGMDVLRCKPPEMVRKEILMHAIAYNLIRSLMQEAATLYEVDLDRISFKGSVDTLRQWSEVLNAAAFHKRQFARLKSQLLELLAEDLVPNRPGRVEPRARKRRPKNYQLLTKPRHEMIVPPHRNRPSAPVLNAR